MCFHIWGAHHKRPEGTILFKRIIFIQKNLHICNLHSLHRINQEKNFIFKLIYSNWEKKQTPRCRPLTEADQAASRLCAASWLAGETSSEWQVSPYLEQHLSCLHFMILYIASVNLQASERVSTLRKPDTNYLILLLFLTNITSFLSSLINFFWTLFTFFMLMPWSCFLYANKRLLEICVKFLFFFITRGTVMKNSFGSII